MNRLVLVTAVVLVSGSSFAQKLEVPPAPSPTPSTTTQVCTIPMDPQVCAAWDLKYRGMVPCPRIVVPCAQPDPAPQPPAPVK